MGTGKKHSTTPILDAKVRFWSKTRTGDPNECWEYTGDKDGFGYGRVTIAGKKMRTHRFSYMIHHELTEEDIKDVYIRHTCDNPACVNPNHLIPGTNQDNLRDKFERGRQNKGEKVPGAKLTADKVIEIRKVYSLHSLNQTQLAKAYGVSLATINDMLLGKTWKHV